MRRGEREPESLGRVMCQCPAAATRVRLASAKSRRSASCLPAPVGHRVELEMDLVETAGEVDVQRRAVVLAFEPVEETVGSPNRGGPRPAVSASYREAEVARHPVAGTIRGSAKGRGSTSTWAEAGRLRRCRGSAVIRPIARSAEPPMTTSSTGPPSSELLPQSGKQLICTFAIMNIHDSDDTHPAPGRSGSTLAKR